PSADHGGVAVSKHTHKVWCHYDDVYNFTWVIYGRKTFLLAAPDDVPAGPTPHVNENRRADTSTPLFRKAVVSKGQLLFLPKGWWHEVRISYPASLALLYRLSRLSRLSHTSHTSHTHLTQVSMSLGQWFTQPGSPNLSTHPRIHEDPYINRQVTIDGKDGVILCFEDSPHKRVYYFYYDGCKDPLQVPQEWFLANPISKKTRGAGGSG
ncbi:MAG: cupin-like domain-containing protein, partial [Rhodoferax sp.]|nr:cupin-like domain-containing protein [Rhodoferax sp.]